MLENSTDPLFIRIRTKISRIDRELMLAQQDVDGAGDGLPGRDRLLARSLGFALHNFYNGVEQILEEIAKEVDGARPSGDGMHSELLDQMAQPTANRPAMVPEESWEQFQDLRRFRHMFRHAYGVELRIEIIMAKFENAQNVIWPQFLTSLEQLHQQLEAPGHSCEI